MREITPLIAGPRCPCGAQRSESAKRCRKCAARGRWHKRKAWRSRKTTVSYRTGKK